MKKTIEITPLQAKLWVAMLVSTTLITPIFMGLLVLNMNERVKDLEQDNVKTHKRLDSKANINRKAKP